MPSHPNPTHEEVAHRARELWHLAGEPHNRDPEFWFAAETRVARERQEIERIRQEATREMESAA